MLLRSELQYEIAITAPTMFLQNSNVVTEPFSPKSPNDFSKITEHIFFKAPNTFSPTHQRISPHVFSKNAEHFTPNLQKRFRRPASSILSFPFSSKKTESLIPPYTCHGLRALCYGWSAVVPWSHLFILHVYGLCARRYGLRASQGRELSTELAARTPFILPTSPSYFDNR